MMPHVKYYCLIFGLVFLAACNSAVQQDQVAHPIGLETTLYFDGDIIAMDGNSAQYAEVFVVRDGKIIFLGSKEEAIKTAGDGRRLADLKGKTAFFSTPYRNGEPGGEKNRLGEPTMPQAELNALVKKVYELGVLLLTHTNGNSTIGMFLKGVELARVGDFSKPRNVTTIHTQFMRRDQLQNFPDLKIMPAFFTEHTFYFSDAHLKNRGENQAACISPMRDAIDLVKHPTNHSDFFAGHLNQMFMVKPAVNRPTRSGGTLGSEHRIPPYVAISAKPFVQQSNIMNIAEGVALQHAKLPTLPSSIRIL